MLSYSRHYDDNTIISFKTENEDVAYQFVIWNMHPVFCSDELVSTVRNNKEKKKNFDCDILELGS